MRETTTIVREEFSLQLNLRSNKWIAPENLPDIIVDRLSLLRVIRNLVDNALKYGGEKLSEIEIGYRQSNDFHILSVRDDGVGLGDENSENLFSMFMRKKTSLGIEGAGIGLAIVKEAAAKQDGGVWIEHSGTRGVSFHISFAKSLGKAH